MNGEGDAASDQKNGISNGSHSSENGTSNGVANGHKSSPKMQNGTNGTDTKKEIAAELFGVRYYAVVIFVLSVTAVLFDKFDEILNKEVATSQLSNCTVSRLRRCNV